MVYNINGMLIGDAGVGKTSLLIRFVDDTWSQTPNATIGIDFKSKEIKMENGDAVNLRIVDTAGQERFQGIVQSHYRNAHAVILVYSCTNRESFTSVRQWAEHARKHRGDAPTDFMLVANKTDDEGKRVVTNEEGKKLAAELKMGYVETSAKTGAHVDACMMAAAKAVHTRMKRSTPVQLSDANKQTVKLGQKPPKNDRCC